ncbi:MAG: 3-methyl-2-oxobutanoate dehydrogenase subunit VorB [Clostridiales bacterium]|nr:3-methyl-2-oxobutanoate dehydrogenase subunit VorB [Clostridiales bacterium]
MKEKVLMKGNEAFGETAIRCGCRFYFGYPITPQNELTEYMSANLMKAGGEFIQAESELAAVNMAYGAACSGGRVLISSSSPGIALMQEGLSFMCSVQVPVVIINVSRGGPGVGSIQPGQADYYQATRGGGNGDYHLIVYAPSSIQEASDIIGKAYDVAEKYRNPVMVLADGMLGQMMEPVLLPEMKEALAEEDIPKVKPWALAGHKDKREHNVIKSLYLQTEQLEETINGYWGKYETAKKELPEYEAYNLDGAEVVMVSYGSTSRIVLEAIDLLAEGGIKAGLIRPITLWPFPYEAFDKIGESTKAVVSVELSKGQMLDDILIGTRGRWPATLVSRTGGVLIYPQEVAERVKEFLEGVR